MLKLIKSKEIFIRNYINCNIVLFILYIFSIKVYANGGDFWGINSKSTSLSTAMTSGVDDYSASFYNPAKLSFIGLSNGGGYQYSLYNLDITFDDNRTEKDIANFTKSTKELQDGYHSYTFGFTIPVFETKEYALVFGMVNNYVENDLAKISVYDEKTYQYYRYHSDVETVLMNAGIGFKFLSRFSIGFGLAQLVSVSGETKVDFNIGNDLDDDPNNDSKIYGKELFLGVVNERSYNFSFFVDYSPILIGLIYKQALKLPYKIPATIKIKDFEGEGKDAVIDLLIEGMGIWLAPEITLGTTYIINKKNRVNLDLSYQFWSKAPKPYSYTTVTNPDENSLLYMNSESNQYLIAYRDTINIALGYSFTTKNYEINSGFLFRPSVIEKTHSQVNYVDNNVLGLSLGTKINLTSLFSNNQDKNLYLNFAYSLQHHINQKENNKYYNSEVNYGGDIHLFNLDISYE